MTQKPTISLEILEDLVINREQQKKCRQNQLVRLIFSHVSKLNLGPIFSRDLYVKNIYFSRKYEEPVVLLFLFVLTS